MGHHEACSTHNGSVYASRGCAPAVSNASATPPQGGLATAGRPRITVCRSPTPAYACRSTCVCRSTASAIVVETPVTPAGVVVAGLTRLALTQSGVSTRSRQTWQGICYSSIGSFCCFLVGDSCRGSKKGESGSWTPGAPPAQGRTYTSSSVGGVLRVVPCSSSPPAAFRLRLCLVVEKVMAAWRCQWGRVVKGITP